MILHKLNIWKNELSHPHDVRYIVRHIFHTIIDGVYEIHTSTYCGYECT
jgi:hypothetical protein